MARTKRYGAVTLRNRGAKRYRLLERGSRSARSSKRSTVEVFTARQLDGRGYYAWACIVRRGGPTKNETAHGFPAARRKCGPDGEGKTPTAAFKKALVALGRKKELK